MAFSNERNGLIDHVQQSNVWGNIFQALEEIVEYRFVVSSIASDSNHRYSEVRHQGKLPGELYRGINSRFSQQIIGSIGHVFRHREQYDGQMILVGLSSGFFDNFRGQVKSCLRPHASQDSYQWFFGLHRVGLEMIVRGDLAAIRW